jgi:hypothetical protein
MREICTSGSEGGVVSSITIPTPIRWRSLGLNRLEEWGVHGIWSTVMSLGFPLGGELKFMEAMRVARRGRHSLPE